MQHRHRRTTTAKKVNPAAILPMDKTQAINLMIRLTKGLVQVSERESQALAQNDLLSFAVLQDEKNLLADRYARASEEFRANASTYRGADKALIDKLSNVQNELGERMKQINSAVEGIYVRAQAKAQSSLITAQALGQNRVTYPEKIEQNNEEAGAAC